MTAKRKSFIDQLVKELPEQPETVRVEAAASTGNPTNARPGVHRTSIVYSDAVQNRLREIAYVERKSLNDLFLEGIDRVIESRGHPERATSRKA